MCSFNYIQLLFFLSSCISLLLSSISRYFFFFHDPAPTDIYTLSLHDALPIYPGARARLAAARDALDGEDVEALGGGEIEEHTSELQSRFDLVCRLLLEKKKNSKTIPISSAINSYRLFTFTQRCTLTPSFLYIS